MNDDLFTQLYLVQRDVEVLAERLKTIREHYERLAAEATCSAEEDWSDGQGCYP